MCSKCLMQWVLGFFACLFLCVLLFMGVYIGLTGRAKVLHGGYCEFNGTVYRMVQP